MAASSPVKSSPTAAVAVAVTPSSNASRSLRGLNKPKCIKCGNVARSRCPYQSCKNCCAKAQNPCHIHVLKGNSSLPDKVPSSNSPIFDQQTTENSHPGNTHRLRQLSNNFAQFSSLQTPSRSRKPLTRKEAQVINEWRFLKLKKFKEGNIEAETESFDRYMQNVSLLEEVFMVNSTPEEQIRDEKSSGTTSSSPRENVESTVQALKLKLGSNPYRTENLRKKVQDIVDGGLRKLGQSDLTNGTSELSDTEEAERMTKKVKPCQGERASALSDLCDKLNKARNEDDLQACRDMASEIFGSKMNIHQTTGEQDPKCDSFTEQKFLCFPPKWVKPVTVEEEALSRLDAQFSLLEDIGDL